MVQEGLGDCSGGDGGRVRVVEVELTTTGSLGPIGSQPSTCAKVYAWILLQRRWCSSPSNEYPERVANERGKTHGEELLARHV